MMELRKIKHFKCPHHLLSSINRIKILFCRLVYLCFYFISVKPAFATVREKRKRISAGKIVQFECEVQGSRPPAVITWRKGSVRLKSSVDKISAQGNITTSILTMTPSSEDHGKFLSCQAENIMIPGSAIEDSWKLEVHCR